MKLFSVIVPHKNTPELLQRLLDSIPRRDDLEVIVVDDNSDLGMVDFNHFPGSDRNDVLLVFTKKGKGAGYARNIGMKHASGEWLIFADADDYFLTENFNRLLDNNIPEECNVLMWETVWNTTGQPFVEKKPSSFDVDLTFRYDAKSSFPVAVAPWTRMVRKCFVAEHHLRFEEQKHANDVMFAARLASVTQSYCYTSAVVYVYDNSKSTLTKRNNPKSVAQRFSTLIRASRFCYDFSGLVALGERLLRLNYTRFLCLTARGIAILGKEKMIAVYRAACSNAGFSTVPYKTSVKLLLAKWKKKKSQS